MAICALSIDLLGVIRSSLSVHHSLFHVLVTLLRKKRMTSSNVQAVSPSTADTTSEHVSAAEQLFAMEVLESPLV
ncbi:hypothetical protein Pcac1_g23502 [Phytophthora cactorum]|uniref:Uncharacterized protein n=1 Tax=Phytophthora cactorum TaxID=29920 RepID=A0A8T1DUU8_9STRA|nr:hypothetical protein Pcac1_g23502 [Phytophthora cactorum]KAG2942682.1 hypothetical protein PC117_g9665 [Phytophthora cactorum]KAG3041868.1 hypothetical protein PC119_g519 [Phytophthora cactorum]KAG3195767.1 hypothetical protein PC128_g8192 [Phytophthora cactorum]